MDSVYYLGLDVHKKTISYCLKQSDGRVVQEGVVEARRGALERWLEQLPKPWKGAWRPRCLPAGSMISCYHTHTALMWHTPP